MKGVLNLLSFIAYNLLFYSSYSNTHILQFKISTFQHQRKHPQVPALQHDSFEVLQRLKKIKGRNRKL